VRCCNSSSFPIFHPDWSPDNLEDGFSLSQVYSARVHASAAIDAIDITPRPKSKRARRLGVFGKFLLGLSVLANLIAAEELRGGISVAEERRKLAITLSGSTLGNCAVDGPCFSSLSYTTNERCEFTTDVAGVLSVISFDTGENRQKARRKLPSDDDMENVGRASHTFSFPCLLPKLTLI
jgi:hypothetical protein